MMENNNFLSQYIEKKALHELAVPLNKALELADMIALRGGLTEVGEAEDLVISLAKTLSLLEEFMAKTKPGKF